MDEKILKNPFVIGGIFYLLVWFLVDPDIVTGGWAGLFYGSSCIFSCLHYFVFPFFISILSFGLAYVPVSKIQNKFQGVGSSLLLSLITLAAIHFGIYIAQIILSLH